LEDEKQELEDALYRIDVKLELYGELLGEESGDAPLPSKPKRRRGRPKGSKNKSTSAPPKISQTPDVPEDELWEEAKDTLPEGYRTTSAEEQKKAIRRFHPTARTPANYGVKAGRPEDVMGGKDDSPKTNVNVTVEDE
jgi:hypothetical protein